MQWLIYNDCVFRTRHLYEYVMFHDRDEFAHFVGLTPKKVNLMGALDQLFEGRDVAGITYWAALYHTHCHMQTVSPCSGSCSVSIQHCLYPTSMLCWCLRIRACLKSSLSRLRWLTAQPRRQRSSI